MSAGPETVATYASVSSLVSAGDSGPRCFLEGTLITMNSKTWDRVHVPVQKIQSGQWALSCDGQDLHVRRATKYSQVPVNIIDLSTPNATMSFTDSHRVETPDGPKLAGELVKDDVVMVTTLATGAVTKLRQPLELVELRHCTVDVYELTFDPDMPVESFFEPFEKILSKGTGVSAPTHMKSRSHHQRQREAQWKRCIPVTPEDSENEQEPASSSTRYIA